MSILTKLWLEVPFKLKDGWSGLLQLMELNLESKEMVKFKFHPEKKVFLRKVWILIENIQVILEIPG